VPALPGRLAGLPHPVPRRGCLGSPWKIGGVAGRADGRSSAVSKN